MKFWQKVPGKVRLKLQGLNIEKFLNKLKTSGYKTYNIRRPKHNILYIDIISQDSYFIICEAEKYGYSVEIIKKFGFYKVVDFMFRRFSLVVCVIFCISVFLFSNLFIWQININGNQNINKTAIVTMLSKNNIGIGRAKTNALSTQVENILRENFKQIALVSAYIYGNSLNINISEKLPQSYLEVSPLVSEFDGVVQSFTLVSGSSNINVGDVIRAGDILVYPYIIDNAGNKKMISAKANVALKVAFSSTISYNENREIYEDTGNKFVSQNISLGKLKLKNDKPCNFSNYRKVVKESFVLNNLFLPLKKTETIFFEQSLVSRYIDFDEVKEELIQDAYKQALANADNYKILDKNHTIVKADELYYITATVVAMVYIGDRL